MIPQPCLQALDAGSSAALPEGLRHDLEELEEHGGVAHLKDLGAQIKVFTYCCAGLAGTLPTSAPCTAVG